MKVLVNVIDHEICTIPMLGFQNMSKGIFLIDREEGEESFPVIGATACFFHGDRGLELIFTAKAGRATKTLPDTQALEAEPELEISVFMDKVDWDALVGKKFEIPESYNEETEEYMTRIYYAEHEDVDDCVVEVKEMNSQGEYFVKITGECIDVNCAEEEGPAATVTVEAWFAPEEKTPAIKKA